jgi:hypothetical protein
VNFVVVFCKLIEIVVLSRFHLGGGFGSVRQIYLITDNLIDTLTGQIFAFTLTG